VPEILDRAPAQVWGNAADAGLRKNDILSAVDRKPVSSLEDLERIYDEVVGNEEREKKVLVEVMRKGYKKWFNLEYAKDYDKE